VFNCALCIVNCALASNCTVRGADPDAPVLCGRAEQGGMLFGESDWTVQSDYVRVRTDGRAFVIGLPMDAPEKIGLRFCRDGKCRSFVYEIDQRKYPEQKIMVAEKFMEYPPEISARIARETALISQIQGTEDFSHLDFLELRYPFEKKYRTSGTYGARRVFNGEAKSPHKGLDMAAPRGTPVRPVGRGRVALALDGYLTGKTVAIDHGFGILTFYMHLDKISVRPGDIVGFDSIVGTVGSTGRASGAHLHLGLYAGQIALDPGLALE
jgi:hypothetical protein